MEIDVNPYAPPTANSTPSGPFFRWRLIPAALIGILGILSFGFGSYFVAMVLFELLTEGFTTFVLESPVAVSFYIVPGVSWISSAVLLWKKRYAYAILLVLVGLVIPVAFQL